MFPLNGCSDAGVRGLLHHEVQGLSPVVLDVGPGGVEVVVARNDGVALHGELEEYPLGGPPLVRRNDVAEPGEIPDDTVEAMEGAGSRVGLVADHHGAPLGGAHGRRPRIGQEIEGDPIRREGEEVIVGLDQVSLPRRSAGQCNGLDNLDPERLDDGRHSAISLRIHESGRIFCARLWPWRTSCAADDLSPALPAAAGMGRGTRKCNLHAQLPGDGRGLRFFGPRHFFCLVWPRLYREGVVALSRPQAAWWVCLGSSRFHERGGDPRENRGGRFLIAPGGPGTVEPLGAPARGFAGIPGLPGRLFSLASPCRIALSPCSSFAPFQEMPRPRVDRSLAAYKRLLPRQLRRERSA